MIKRVLIISIFLGLLLSVFFELVFAQTQEVLPAFIKSGNLIRPRDTDADFILFGTSSTSNDKFSINLNGDDIALFGSGSFSGFGLTDCDAESQTLNWDLTTKRFSCFIDDGGDTQIELREGLTDLGNISSLSFEPGHFNVTIPINAGVVKLDWGAGGPASLSENETITGNWVNTAFPWADNEVADNITLTNLTQITNRSILDTTGTLTVARGGTNATSFTAGSLIFTGSGGTSLTQDNASLFWDDTNNRLGIGTTGPSGKLHLSNTAADVFLYLEANTVDTNKKWYLESGNDALFRIGNTGQGDKVTITHLGNVGIGTTEATTKLEIVGTASASAFDGIAFGGIDCNDAGDQLLWSAGLFTCETLADVDIPDTLTIGSASTVDKGALANTGTLGFDWADSEVSDVLTVSGGTIGSNNISAASTWTTLGQLTIGDGGDAIVINSSNWDVSSTGVFSGLTGLTSTGTINFSGATLFRLTTNGTVATTGDLTLHTASRSLDYFDGTNRIVKLPESCFTYYIESPTSTNPLSIGHKRFFDPFTITRVGSVASGSNAAGWNLRFGVPGTVTTNVFTTAKSASTSSSPIYTSFANSAILDGNVLDVRITSASATLQSFSTEICGRYNH